MRVQERLKALGRRTPFWEGLKRRVAAAKQRVRDRRAEAYRRRAGGPCYRGETLILMNHGIGNAVEATPLVQAIRMLWPRERITLGVGEWDLFDGWALVDEVVHGLAGLEGKRFDRTFLTWTAKLPPAEMKFDPGELIQPASLFDHRFLKPEREHVLDMLRRRGYRGPTPPLYVSLRPPALMLPEGAPMICLAPGGKAEAVWRHKRWPYYRELTAALLRKHPGASILVVGTPADEFPAEVIDGARVVDLRGQLTLAQTAWVLKRADAAAGNDSGPMHIADAVMTPAVIFFGPTCELKNGPAYRGRPLAGAAPCRPCQFDDEKMRTCPDPVCLSGLSAERALAAVEEALASRRPR